MPNFTPDCTYCYVTGQWLGCNVLLSDTVILSVAKRSRTRAQRLTNAVSKDLPRGWQGLCPAVSSERRGDVSTRFGPWGALRLLNMTIR